MRQPEGRLHRWALSLPRRPMSCLLPLPASNQEPEGYSVCYGGPQRPATLGTQQGADLCKVDLEAQNKATQQEQYAVYKLAHTLRHDELKQTNKSSWNLLHS